jgi:uncharacterized protein involved in outer membrane biogenesis
VKKLGIAVGFLFVLFLAAIVLIPRIVDVDQYRPKIEEAVNQKINGSFSLGKLSLSLWGHIEVEVNGLKLRDVENRDILTVSDARFFFPFLPLIKGAPVVDFRMNQPVVELVKNKSGKFNVQSLMKESRAGTAPTPSGAPSPTPTEKATSGEGTQLPALASKARLGLQLRNATVIYRDETTASSTSVKDLNLVIKDLSLSHPTEMELWADLNSQVGKSLTLRGPARLTAEAQPEMKDGKFHQASVKAKMELSDVEILMPGTFEKKKGVVADATFAGVVSEQNTKIDDLTIQFLNAVLKGQGTVSRTGAEQIVDLSIKSNDFEFKPWNQLSPILNEYELGGAGRIDVALKGSAQKPDYWSNIAVKSLTAKAPKLKTQPKLDGTIRISTDQIENLLFTLNAPANHLKVQGKMISFSKPKATFEVTSNGMDLDQLIEFAPSKKAQAGTPAEAEAPSGKETPKSARTDGSAANYDDLLAPIRENKVLQEMIANISVDMKSLKSHGVKLDNLLCKMTMKDLVAGVDGCGFKVFGGVIRANGRSQLKPKIPMYQFDMKVTDLDLKQAIESQMALFKNTMQGKATLTLQGQGMSFNPDPAMANLKANGSAKVNQAVFATIDVMGMVKEAVNSSLGKVQEKVPVLKGKSVQELPAHESRYESISSDIKIADNQFIASNFNGKVVPNQGVDLKGDTSINMKDYSLVATWQIIDTYNVTRLKDVSVEQGGVKIDHVFAEGRNPVQFPVTIGCKLTAPCFSYTQVPETLAKVALNNLSRGLTGHAKEQIRKQAESLLKQAPPQLQQQLQDRLKGLFH